MMTETNGVRPITAITVPLVAVISIVAGGLWAGFGWWQSELRTIQGAIDSHHQAEGHPAALAHIAALERELSGIRERLSIFDAQLKERDAERVRRLEAQEERSIRRDHDWEVTLSRMALLEEELAEIRRQHAQLTLREAVP